ncbi:MAG: methyltransferase domain-containing protein [Chitinophagales bacterium]
MVKNHFKKDLEWNEKANINPLYAIMSTQEFENAEEKNISTEQVAKFYDAGKQIWDTNFQPALNKLSGGKPLAVLEWGCGMGRLLLYAMQEKHLCTGVDISSKQLELLKIYFPIPQNPETILYSPLQPIPLPDESFDFIYSHAVLQHIKSRQGLVFVIQEMIRLLKKDGILKIQFRTVNKRQTNNEIIPVYVGTAENRTLILYLRKISFFYIPIMRIIKHNHWGGAGCYMPEREYKRIFKRNNIQILSFEYKTSNDQALVWITAKK